MALEQVEIVSADRTHAVAIWRNLVLQVWGSAAPVAPFQKTLIRMRRWKTAAPPNRPLLMAGVVMEHSPMPNTEARAIAAQYAEMFDHYVSVVEGDSTRVSLVRAVLIGMSLMSRVHTKFDVVSTAKEGARRLAARSGAEFTAAEVEELVAQLRDTVRNGGRAYV